MHNTEFPEFSINAFVRRGTDSLIIGDITGDTTTAAAGERTFVAHTVDSQGPLAELFAWGADIEDATHHLAEMVWGLVNDGAVTGFGDEPLLPRQISAIHMRAMTTTKHPITSTVDPDTPPLVVPYEISREGKTYYATTPRDLPAPFGDLVLPAPTVDAATTQLAKWVRTHILIGNVEPSIARTWTGQIALERVHHYLYSTESLRVTAA